MNYQSWSNFVGAKSVFGGGAIIAPFSETLPYRDVARARQRDHFCSSDA